jgi:AcrR family transcriptional regulator
LADEARLATCSTRQRRKAKIKLALVATAANKIEAKPLDAVSVREICESISLPESSFYHYFTKKSDLLSYCVQLWNLEIQLRAAHAVNKRNGLARISGYFEQVARHVQGRPSLTGEIIAYMAKLRDGDQPPSISRLERQIAFPEFPDIEDYEPTPIEELLIRHVRWAVDNGELPRHTHVDSLASSLATLFFGAPVAHRSKRASIEKTYRRQLSLQWLGARGSNVGGVKPAQPASSLHHRWS